MAAQLLFLSEGKQQKKTILSKGAILMAEIIGTTVSLRRKKVYRQAEWGLPGT